MAEANYTIRTSFGLNVKPTEHVAEKTIAKALTSLWEPVLEYLETHENVFDGSVIKEINKTNFQTMRLGMIMEDGKRIGNLDLKM